MLPPRRVEINRVIFGSVPGNTGPDPQSDIYPELNLHGDSNVIVSNRIIVTDYNRVRGDNFEVFQHEQAPDFIVPRTGSVDGLVGSPSAGLTNQQAMARFGIAISGAIAPCTETRPTDQGIRLWDSWAPACARGGISESGVASLGTCRDAADSDGTSPS